MPMTMYERIRQLRLSAGMSQDDLARAMGYKDRSMITKIEAGKVDISQKKIIAFAKVLNTTPTYLIMGVEDLEDRIDFIFDKASKAPHTKEAELIAKGVDKLPQDLRVQALNVIRAVFPQYSEYFEGE